MKIAVAALFIATLIGPAAHAEDLTVRVPGAAAIAVKADFPAGEGPFPALVLASGQGYHMSLPLMEATARAMTAQGIAVLRFNWAYFSAEPKGRPSADLAQELKEFQAVVQLARQHPKVQAKQLHVGGKSLGTAVAWKALAADASLRSAVMLTPVCSRVPKGGTAPRSEAQENYPGFDTERRPVLWVAGDNDPLCDVTTLYGMGAASQRATRVAVASGDHVFENPALEPLAREAALNRNHAAVAAWAAAFVADMTEAAASQQKP